jgi:hypothetical protein
MSATSAGKPFQLVCLTLFVICFLFALPQIHAQKRRPAKGITAKKRDTPSSQRQIANYGVVIDERLSVLRFEPSLSAIPLQRMRSGRTMEILGDKSADGVTFYRVQLAGEKGGWVQAEAIATNVRRGDDERLAQLIRASNGFDQIERATIFLENFPASPFRPAVLLLLGDLVEQIAQRLSRDAGRRFNNEEMRASGAPVYSFYMNYNGLDRYRRLGINFVFNQKTKEFHYNGTSWEEILKKHSASAESGEAKKRLEALTEKMKQ